MEIEKRPLSREIEVDSWPTPTSIIPPAEPELPSQRSIYKVFRNPSVVDMISHTGFQGGPISQRKGYRLAMWSWFASFIDMLVLISISCVFLLAASRVAHLGGSSWQFATVFLMCSWIYMVTLRVILGSSIGEWACDIRLGQPHERMSLHYPFRVIWRESLILMTGLITLPLCSLIFGLDMAGKISGLRLFSLK